MAHRVSTLNMLNYGLCVSDCKVKVRVHQLFSFIAHSSQHLAANQRRGSSTPNQSWYQFIDHAGMKGLVGLVCVDYKSDVLAATLTRLLLE
jgi:hypothetical protein